MNNDDKRRFASILQGYQVEIHQRPPLSEAALRIWWAMLEKYSLTDVERALHRYHETPGTGQFPPKPADVIGFIEGLHADAALIQWHRVATAVPRVGRYGKPDFGDALTHDVIAALGGWGRLCALSVDEMPHAGRDFQRLYVALKNGGRAEGAPVAIGGPEAVRIGPTGLPIRAHEALQLTKEVEHATT